MAHKHKKNVRSCPICHRKRVKQAADTVVRMHREALKRLAGY